MDKEFWLDGFNFFHHWDSTKEFFRSDADMSIVRALDRSIRILGHYLGRRCRYTVVYLDGGLYRNESRVGNFRIRYCGPGKKADDRMLGDLGALGFDAKMVTAVSNDRELKANLRNFGASCLGVGEYLGLLEGKKNSSRKAKGKLSVKNGKPGKNSDKRRGGAEDVEIMREKSRFLSDSEVNAWLDFFGGDVEA